MMKLIRWNQVIIAFLIGCVVTAGVLHEKRAFFKPPKPQDRFEKMLDRFSRKLDLTAEQKVQVGAIFQAKREKINALRDEVEPRFEDVRRNTSEEIRRLLSAEQQTKFDEMEKEQAERKRRWRARGEEGLPPPPR